ncbi:MAG: hypothetical protein Q9217_002494 [Psora testacea]
MDKILVSSICRRCRARGFSTSSKQRVTERRPSEKLPNTPARTRFAPSPTGYLHLGSLRTALFNYLTAKATGGHFILRIEDTDKKRFVEDAEERLYADMRWAGLQWDEGPDIGGPYGPYRQSERTRLYQEHAGRLLRAGHAYRCFCSPERLNRLANDRHLLGLPTDYDRKCINIPPVQSEDRAAKGEGHIIRLKMPEKIPSFDDLIYGIVKDRRSSKKIDSHTAIASYEDPVLVKSDGLPTYHLANVVDDHHMGITHVIRAAEWMSSTPKHMVMYGAFGWEPPVYAHVGLLQDDDGQKLSKRAGSNDISVRSYADSGIFPEALINFVALLGWSHRSSVDLLRRQELVDNFDLKFTKGNSRVGPAKLLYLQKRYAQLYVEERGEAYEGMVSAIRAVALQQIHANPEGRIKRDDEIEPLVAALLSIEPRFYTTPREFFDRYAYLFYTMPRERWRACLTDSLSLVDIGYINAVMGKIPEDGWSADRLNEAIKHLADYFAGKYTGPAEGESGTRSHRSQSLHYMRWALTGGRPGPSLADVMVLVGRDITLHRLETAEIEYKASIREAEVGSPN